jgi:hypothetical protein
MGGRWSQPLERLGERFGGFVLEELIIDFGVGETIDQVVGDPDALDW